MLKQIGITSSIYRFPLNIILMSFMVCLASACVSHAETLSSKQQLKNHFENKVQVAEVNATCDMSAVKLFYEERHWKPIWNKKRYKSLLKNIRQLRDDGLDPESFKLAELENYRATFRIDSERKKDRHKEARYFDRELLATCVALESWHQLRYGKVRQSALNPTWTFGKPALNNELIVGNMRNAVESNRLDEVFQEARPTLPAYAMLREELARLREQANSEVLTDMANKALTDDAATTNILTNTAPAKIAPAELSVQEKINRIRVNLERMRWYLHDMPERFVTVDIAGFGIALVENGKSVWTSRVQVGQVVRQTPVFQSTITHVTLNPKWGIPPTIFKQDSLPAIRKDITYLERNRIRVVARDGKELDKNTIDWNQPGEIYLVQDAGPEGALGQLAIRFPNGFAIFLHETPHNKLFEKEQRAFSSGCVRVENIRDLAALLLDEPERWSRAALESAIDEGKTREVFLSEQVPIFITYITVAVDNQGAVNYLTDVYNQDPAILDALNKQ